MVQPRFNRAIWGQGENHGVTAAGFYSTPGFPGLGVFADELKELLPGAVIFAE